MNDDLIELLKNLRDHQKIDADLIDAVIAALSPVLPEDVQKICHNLRDAPASVANWISSNEAADLIERLARDVEWLRGQVEYHVKDKVRINMDKTREIVELQARIKELKSKLALASKNNNQQTT